MKIKALTKYFPILLGLALLFGASPLEAKITKVADTNIEFIIHTWGGGGLFAIIFNVVSVLLYGSSGWNGIFMIALSIGGFSALIMAFIKGSFEALLTQWFFPSLLICGILLGPRDTLFIKDHLVNKSGSSMEQTVYKVDNVPYFMKIICSIISQISYKLTHNLERVTHEVDSSQYNWTGHIYAGDTLFQAGKVDINNPYLKKNLHNYVYDCVFNDINMEDPWYTKDDLYKADNIIDFMEQEAGVWLSTKYTDNKGHTTPMRCKAAIGNIKKEFSGSALVNGKPSERFLDSMKTEIFGDLNGDAQKLIGMSQESLKGQKELLQQAFSMDSVQNSLAPNTYATLKAEQMHRQQQGILGSMGAKSIVSMKNFFEALIYCSFPIILILAVATLGFRSLFNWLQFLVWINLWPPFFVVINFVLNTTWDFRMAKVFGVAGANLSIFSSHGLADLYSSMESIAAGALFCVPWISYAIVKGGVSSMMHLAGTLNAPAQAAASQAASEKVSGNYSLGNVAYQNENIGARSMFQQNDNPSLQQGGMSYKSGNMMTSLGENGEVVMQKGMSSIGADVSVGEAYGQGVQTQFSESEQKLESAQGNFQSSWNIVGNTGRNFHEALGKDHSFSHLKSKSEQDSATELWNTTDQQVKDFNQNYQSSNGSTIEAGARLSAGLDIKGFGLGGNMHTGASTKNDTSEAVVERDSQLIAINDNMQRLRQYQEQDSMSENLTSTQRAAIDHGETRSEAFGYTDQLTEAKSNHAAWSEVHDDFKKGDSTFRQNLNNDFAREMLEKYKDTSAVNRMVNTPQELQQNLKEFNTNKANKMVESKFDNVKDKAEKMHINNETITSAKEIKKKGDSMQADVKSQVKTRGEIDVAGAPLEAKWKLKDRTKKEDYSNHIKAKEHIDAQKEEFKATKVSETRKEAVKKQAQEIAALTVGKKVGKFFYDGKKPIGFGDDD